MKWARLARGFEYRDLHGIEIMTQGEVEERNKVRIPQNTRKSTSCHTRVWNEWTLERNSLPLERRKADGFTIVPEYDTLYTLCDLGLCFWLSEFAHEIKQKDGAEYPPNTLYPICAGLQRALRGNGLPEFDIFRYPKYNDYSKIPLIRE
ncbi:hypothetical protein P5673_017677 [Acropora cervicornis]|uniref:QRICH1-like domain-containing protein n=1 Tax=Acropora cervicornis TaxID=6130 RepID=A0AAD9QE37_ACRCE|nr:hypothetical protein P5673_017677 [Acropora cervicornis]